jgi:hypothetical protein
VFWGCLWGLQYFIAAARYLVGILGKKYGSVIHILIAKKYAVPLLVGGGNATLAPWESFY